MGPGLDMVADSRMFGGTAMECLAYHLHMEVEWAEEQRRCDDTVVSRGSDPWSFRCQLDRGHEGCHRMEDPMGPETGELVWGPGLGAWEWTRG
jgi:hypothetical protein